MQSPLLVNLHGKCGACLQLLVLFLAESVHICCTMENLPVSPRLRDSEPIAIINGRSLTREKFEAFVDLDQSTLKAGGLEASRSVLFTEFVMREVVIQEAEKAAITVSESEVEGQIKEWMLPDQEPSSTLASAVRDFLRVQKFIRDKIGVKVKVNLEELETYYTEYIEGFVAQERAHILEILVAEKALAERIRGQLHSGDARTFKDWARRQSTGLTAWEDGDLGVFERGDLPQEFEKVIFSLKPGEISSVFHSTYGYHIFMMEERVQRHAQKFYEVQQEIFRKLIAQKERDAIKDYLGQLVRTASIVIIDESLKSEGKKIRNGKL